MRASRIRIEERHEGAALCADITSRVGGLTDFPLYIQFAGMEPDQLVANGDAFVPALLWASMKLGEDLEIEAPISRELYENTEAIQSMAAEWFPGMRRVRLEADCRPPLRPASGSGLFLSCGVDSSFSLMRRRGSLTHLLSSSGFDLDAGGEKNFGWLRQSALNMGNETGLQVVLVHTNLRAVLNRYLPWGYCGFSLGPATVGLAAQGFLGRCTVAADRHYSQLTPQPCNPVMDGLWSAENLTFVFDGFDMWRLEKVRRIAGWDCALTNLRVCLDPTAHNCGVCEKCIRTMLELHVLGALDRTPAFKSKLTAARIAEIRLAAAGTMSYYTEILEAMGDSAVDRAYAAAIRRALRKGRMRLLYYGLRKRVGSAPGGAAGLKALDKAAAWYSGSPGSRS
jgi:hypothetical protein